MLQPISQLRSIITEYKPQLEHIDEAAFAAKPLPHKWSKKEILGHLVDSAQSNIRRFVVGQYEDRPHIMYAQDEWVRIADYQHYPTSDLISLWALLNKHIIIIWENMPAGVEQRECLTNELHSIHWLAADYNKHLLHHLHHLLVLEGIAYP